MTQENNYTRIFSHNIGVINQNEQEILRNATVAVAGVGAIGSNTAHMLARAGVGKFILADPDTFSYSNINRQCGATIETVGRKKVDVVAELIQSVNDAAVVEKYPRGLDSDNIEAFLNTADVVLDGIDFLVGDVRKKIIDNAQAKGIYLFLAPALGFGASIVVFGPDGPTYEEFFGPLKINPGPDDLFNFGKKIFPVMPDYIDKEAYLKSMDGRHHIPTFAPPILLASTLEATDVICHLIGKREPVCVPRVKWIDLMEQRLEIIEA